MDIFRISQNTRDLPIEQFHLPSRVFSKLSDEGIRNFEGLVGALRSGQTVLNKNQKLAVREIVKCFQQSLGADQEPVWHVFWENLGITLIPAETKENLRAEEVLRLLSGTIENILRFYDSDGRKWRTIERRFGLNGTTHLTLDQIGQAFGLTRERVRQIENACFDELRDVLLNNKYVGKDYHVLPEITDCIGNLFDAITNDLPEFVFESQLMERVQKMLEFDPCEFRNELCVLFSLFGLREIKGISAGSDRIWGAGTVWRKSLLEKTLNRLDALFTEDYVPPMDSFEILVHVNTSMPKGEKLTASDLDAFLPFCDAIELLPDGRYQAKFKCIKLRAGQAERILVEAGAPLHIEEITKQMNKRLQEAKQKGVTVLNIANIMSTEVRFEAVGSSGLRSLSRWKNVEARSILELMEECLVSLGRPASAEEIFDYVSSRRPVSPKSIMMYVDMDARFVESGFRTWGLASWPKQNAVQSWTPSDVAEFVVEIFKTRKQVELEYSELTAPLAQAIGISVAQARGILRHNPVLSTRRVNSSGLTFAKVNSHYRSDLSKPRSPRKRKKSTLYDRSQTIVRAILERQPENEVALSTIVLVLVQDLGLRDKTAYQYISKMDFVEKLEQPGMSERSCRLKNGSSPTHPD